MSVISSDYVPPKRLARHSGARSCFGKVITRRAFLQSLTATVVPCFAREDRPIRLAIGTYAMKALPAEEALRVIARIGYDGVEICLMPGWPTDPAKFGAQDRRQLRQSLRETGLAVPALQESLTITGSVSKRRSNLERLKMATDLCNELGLATRPVIDTIVGGKCADWETSKESIAEELSAWASIATGAGVTICFKPHADQAVNTPARALWLLKEVGSPRIRVIYDYSHFYLEGLSLVQSLRELLPYTALISLKDSVETDRKHEYLLPGDGKTDYLDYFRLLRKLGYAGFTSVEVSSMIQQRPGYDPVDTARRCYERLAPLMARAGIRPLTPRAAR